MIPATQLDGIELKLRQLAAKVERQRARYEAVVAENDRLQRELDRQTGVVTSLQEKLAQATTTTSPPAAAAAPSKATVTAVAAADPAEVARQRETIAFCLQEIDRCIEWLHRN